MASISAGQLGLASTTTTDEYGQPIAGSSTTSRYGWHGAAQRASDNPGGLIIMGVRLYNPSTGRFLQPDSVYGGGDNAYGHPADPVNMADLDGRMWKWAVERGINVLQTVAGAACVMAAFWSGMICGVVVGALIGAIGNVAIQMLVDNKKLSKINWGKVAGAAFDGAFNGGFGRLGGAALSQMKAGLLKVIPALLSKIRGKLASIGFTRLVVALSVVQSIVINMLSSPPRRR